MRREDDVETDATGDEHELAVSQAGPVLRLTMNRPKRRNALSRALVAALRDAFAGIAEGGATRVVVLGGEGAVFCAGGDIAEYAEAPSSGRSRQDAEELADALALIAACPAPVVARVHGAAFGGGVGLICASDFAIAVEGTRFSLSEARLGLVPATISPYVVAALGEREAKARMLEAAPFGPDEALRIGLVQRVVPPDRLDANVDELVRTLLQCAPGALAATKRLLPKLRGADPASMKSMTTEYLIERKASAEGQEGLRAFLEKRPPSWTPS